jgi:CYTH domain-containing protein
MALRNFPSQSKFFARRGQPIPRSLNYLTLNGSVSLRLRIIDRGQTLTVKSAVAAIARLEFEYEIPLTEGVVLLGYAGERGY